MKKVKTNLISTKPEGERILVDAGRNWSFERIKVMISRIRRNRRRDSTILDIGIKIGGGYAQGCDFSIGRV